MLKRLIRLEEEMVEEWDLCTMWEINETLNKVTEKI